MHAFSTLYPNPLVSGGPQNGFFYIHENFIKQKLKWTFQVGQCLMKDPPPTPSPDVALNVILDNNILPAGTLECTEQALGVISEDIW